ncbi:DUF5694 domain-containing protein [Halobacterium wangiae]|uniref:DUF5694 domain-containing protein n=1 Tax=Halobacterium wangiae TaxID=2902623 RepID=UPI001E400368|nr:DUF5694 domain-containing protein [Halobacterium wangiae]
MTPTAPRNDWPEPTPEQTRVLLLGTSHLDSPRVAGVLGDDRQREFEALTDRLADWEPDTVAVERSHRHQDHVDALYTDYRTGERAFDEQYTIESPRMGMDDPEVTCQSEVVQIGFRLAAHLDHDRVHAVDSMMDMAAHLDRDVDDEWFEEQVDAAVESLPEFLVPDYADHVEKWDNASVTEFLAWYNREEHLRTNDRTHFAGAFGGPEDRYVGSRLLTGWYERNLKTAENLRRVAGGTDTDRVVLVVGQGHVHVLRHLLDNVPLLCPVSPVPVLED